MNGSRSLRAHAAARGLLVGCAVRSTLLDGQPQYATTVAEQANIIVPEDALKWDALRPAPDRFDFRRADDIVVFALTHSQRVRGHTLCWHEALPAWFSATVNQQNARQFLVQHIQTVAGRYAGKLQSWDVVNEAIDPRSPRADGLRDSRWLELIGPDYIELAFRTTRQADPTALLTYNDYGFELDTAEQIEKRGEIMMLVRRLKARGVPIDAVGIQSHLQAWGQQPGAGIVSFVRSLAEIGLQVFITEMDVSDQQVPGLVPVRDKAVAQVYADYLTMMLAEPNVTAVLTWGITDRYTWLNSPQHLRADGKPLRPLPFGPDYDPTPAFFAERNAIDSRFAGKVVHQGDPYAPFRPVAPLPHISHE